VSSGTTLDGYDGGIVQGDGEVVEEAGGMDTGVIVAAASGSVVTVLSVVVVVILYNLKRKGKRKKKIKVQLRPHFAHTTLSQLCHMSL